MDSKHAAGARRNATHRCVLPPGIATWAMVAAIALGALAPSDRAHAQQYYEPLPDEYYREDRVRFAAEGHLGGMLGAESGLGGGIAIGIGLQLNDIVATYAVHRLWIADLIASDQGVFAVSTNALVFDLTLFERVQVGAGPSLDVGIGGLCGENATRCDGLGDLHLGAEIRIAVSLAERNRARRRGLVISAVAHPTFIDRNVTVLMLGLGVGYQMF